MNKVKKSNGYRSVLHFALHCAIRRTLKAVPGFLAGTPGLVILVPAEGRSPAEFVKPVADEFCGDEWGTERKYCGYMVARAKDTREDIFSEFESECRSKVRAIIIAETEACVPEELRAAADAVLVIDPVSPGDLAAACKEVLDVEATEEQAAEALAFPETFLLASLRPRRAMSDVLRRLHAAPPPVCEPKPKPVKKSPKLEAMHGYGRARDWGLQLARDLADWKAGVIAWDDLDRGMLLSGPPGVGKTVFATALAAQCEVSLIASSLSQWQSRGHLGDLLKAMRADFAKAKQTAPCIIFIDELDSLGDRQTFHRDHANYSTQVVNGLLECLDGVDGREGVIVIGASNNPANIDAALLRAGRFDNHITISLPDNISRIAIMREELILEFEPDEVDRLELLTAGFSGADLVKACRDARRIARRESRPVAAADIFAGLPSLVKVEGAYRRTAAIHEGGHALVGWRLGVGRFLGAIVADHVNPGTRTSQIGAALFEHQQLTHRTRQSYLDRVASLLAGIAAEAVIFGDYGDGAGGGEGSDLEVATNLCTLMEAQYGFGDRLRYSALSDAVEFESLRRSDADLAKRVETTLRQQFNRAKEIIERDRSLLESIAKTLFDHGQIDPERLQQLASVGMKGSKAAVVAACVPLQPAPTLSVDSKS